jgi:hypothetical protein
MKVMIQDKEARLTTIRTYVFSQPKSCLKIVQEQYSKVMCLRAVRTGACLHLFGIYVLAAAALLAWLLT